MSVIQRITVLIVQRFFFLFEGLMISVVAAFSLAEYVLGGQSACVAALVPAVDAVSFSPVECTVRMKQEVVLSTGR